MKSYRVIFLILIFLGQFYFAQDPISFQIAAEDGLPNQTVYSIAQDSKGFIWLGTDAGLIKYDGIHFKELKCSKQKSRSITGITEGKNNRLYMCNFSHQIFYTENDSLYLLDSWNHGSVSNITTDTAGNLWVAYSEGIQCYEPQTEKWTYYATQPNQIGSFTHSCFTDETNTVWLIGPDGLVSIKNRKPIFYKVNWKTRKVSGEYQLAINSKEKFIFSRVDGEVLMFKNNKVVPFFSKNLNPLLIDKKITRVEEDKNRRLWIYTYSGIIIYDIENDKSNWIYNNMAFSGSICDDENSTWLATLDDGLIKIPNIKHTFWQIKTGDFILNKLSKITSYNNLIAVGTTDGKIGILNISTKNCEIKNLKTKLDIQCITFSKDEQSIYFSAQNTIYQLKHNNITEFSSNYPPTKDISELDNSLIVATSKGSFVINKKNSKNYKELNTKWSRSIVINKTNQNLYIATNAGIDVFKQTAEQWQKSTTLIPESQILSITQVINHSIYALAFNGKIYAIDDENNYKLIYSIPETVTVYQLKVDKTHIYCSSNKGIWVITKQGEFIKVINHLSGLYSDITSSFDVRNNTLWITHNKGIQEIPMNEVSKKSLPRIYLKKVICNNQSASNQNLILNYNEGLKVQLEAVSLSSEEKYQYAYRINNQGWLYLPASIQEINFPSISDGDFTIEVKLINHIGEDSINSIVLSGYVNPPFWQTWWFYSIIGLVCLVIGVIVFKERIKRLEKKQAKELERINLEHQLKLSQETALRAQMNPHFIFNVLNSIKSYIYENDKKKAVGYLQRFSDLIRKILEQSSVSWVKLEEEINFLKLYIELESMLFSDDFDYAINIESDIDTNHSRIPSLILQPFIENAFKHGLRHKEGKKHIAIDFKLEKNEILIVTITDNGIGREQSSIINQSKQNKHKSFSTEAINRVSIINKNQPGVVSVLYRDLVNDLGNSTGTSVEIKINVNE